MDDTSKTLRRWVTFAGCVLVVLVLYWAQTVLVPIALAILLTFVLSPPVTGLQRWIGRIPAVLAMVTLVFSLLGLAGNHPLLVNRCVSVPCRTGRITPDSRRRMAVR